MEKFEEVEALALVESDEGRYGRDSKCGIAAMEDASQVIRGNFVRRNVEGEDRMSEVCE